MPIGSQLSPAADARHVLGSELTADVTCTDAYLASVVCVVLHELEDHRQNRASEYWPFPAQRR